MAESCFDRAAFAEHLRTRRFGRVLFTRAEVDSTNDVAWELAQGGVGEGACVVADAQRSGRGRLGRVWHTTPGRALALSLVLQPGCEPAVLAMGSLVAGLALSLAAEDLGVEARLKWPNDLLVGGRKVSGILAESRRTADSEVVVMGVGVNVAQDSEDFPPDLRAVATSMKLAGSTATREAVAAGFLNRLEPLWDDLHEGDRTGALDAWRARAEFWGHPVTVTTPTGRVVGVARSLDEQGGLIVELESGRSVTVYAGDMQAEWPEGVA